VPVRCAHSTTDWIFSALASALRVTSSTRSRPPRPASPRPGCQQHQLPARHLAALAGPPGAARPAVGAGLVAVPVEAGSRPGRGAARDAVPAGQPFRVRRLRERRLVEPRRGGRRRRGPVAGRLVRAAGGHGASRLPPAPAVVPPAPASASRRAPRLGGASVGARAARRRGRRGGRISPRRRRPARPSRSGQGGALAVWARVRSWSKPPPARSPAAAWAAWRAGGGHQVVGAPVLGEQLASRVQAVTSRPRWRVLVPQSVSSARRPGRPAPSGRPPAVRQAGRCVVSRVAPRRTAARRRCRVRGAARSRARRPRSVALARR